MCVYLFVYLVTFSGPLIGQNLLVLWEWHYTVTLREPTQSFRLPIQTLGVWVAVSHISIIRCVPPLIPIVWQHSWQNMPVMIEWSCSVIFYSANYLHYLVITNKTFICYDYTSYYYGLYWGLHQATPHHTTPHHHKKHTRYIRISLKLEIITDIFNHFFISK